MRIKQHSLGRRLPNPPSTGGTLPSRFNSNYEVLHQDEPTPSHPVSAHKQMAGNHDPGHIGQHKG